MNDDSTGANAPSVSSATVKGAEVLLVDGDERVRDGFCKLLTGAGAMVTAVEGEQRALELAEESERSWAQLFEGRRLVLIDSLRALLPPGVDENSSQVRYHLDMLARISEKEGCAIVVLHHARKSPQNGGSERLREAVRGSGALFDALACCLV